MAHSWLFEIDNTQFLSTSTVTYNSQAYSAVIDPSTFSGAKVVRAKWDIDVYNSTEISFDIINPGNTNYNASSFENKTLIIRKLNNGTEERSWRYLIKNAKPEYHKIKITARNFISKLVDGVYPEKLLADIWPDGEVSNSKACVPELFGQTYVPLEPVVFSGQGVYFPVGDSGATYTISEVSAPHDYDGVATYTGFTYEGYTDSNNPGYMFTRPMQDDSPIFWRKGSRRLPPLFKIRSSATESMTNIIDVIKHILKKWGAVDGDFGDTWATVQAAIATRGDVFQRGYFEQADRKKVLANLCACAHVTILDGEKLEIYQLSKTPVMTITSEYIVKPEEKGPGTFSYSKTNPSEHDSGYIEFPLPDKPQDQYAKKAVTAKSTTDNISSDTLTLPGVSDDQNAQRIGQLYFQRKLMKKARVSFTGVPSLISLRPDQVITISGADYGGTYPVLIDSMKINHNSTINFECIVFSCALDDWADLTPPNLNIQYDPATDGLSVLGEALEFTQNWSNEGATAGATWDSDIEGQPPDASILNVLQQYDDIQGTKPDANADQTTVTTIKTALDGSALITTGRIQDGLDPSLSIDFDAKKISVGGDGVVEVEGDFDFLYNIDGVAGTQSYKSVKRLEIGTAGNNDVVNIPGYWKGTPNITVSPSYGPTYHPEYTDRAQALHCAADSLTNYAAGQWRFTANSFLRIEPTEVVLTTGSASVNGSGSLPSGSYLYSNSSGLFFPPDDTKRCKVTCIIAATAGSGVRHRVMLQYQINQSGSWVNSEDTIGDESGYYNSYFPTYPLIPCFSGSVSGKTAEHVCRGVSSSNNWWDYATTPPSSSITNIQFRLAAYTMETGDVGESLSFSASFSTSFLKCMVDGRDIVNAEGKLTWFAWE